MSITVSHLGTLTISPLLAIVIAVVILLAMTRRRR